MSNRVTKKGHSDISVHKKEAVVSTAVAVVDDRPERTNNTQDLVISNPWPYDPPLDYKLNHIEHNVKKLMELFP